MSAKTINVAEVVRFELTDPFESPVFKAGALDHSAKLPYSGTLGGTRTHNY